MALKMRTPKPWALMLLALLALAPLAQAQTTIDQKSIDRAQAFLKTGTRGRNVLSYVHFGADYKAHTYHEIRKVLNKPGAFALVYKFKWEKDGETSLAFLCDAKGNVYQVQVLATNAFLQQPYALANASISVVGNLILEAFRDQMSKEDIQQVRQFIDNPNARGLLEMSLKLQQSFGP